MSSATIADRNRPAAAPQASATLVAGYGAATMAMTPGKILVPTSLVAGRYRVFEKLGCGDTGEVYRVEHEALRKTYAMKVILPALSAEPTVVERFKREAIAASHIGQQNIIDIADSGRTDDGRFYFVMEYLQGLNLAQALKAGPMRSHRAIRIALQLGRALSAAHQMGIVHRDLQPRNVYLLDREGQPDFVKLLGFGVAKVLATPDAGKQSAVGVVTGSPGYASPEQLAGTPADARTDIYSLGVLLYEMVCGRPLFEGETPSVVMARHLGEPPAAMGASITPPVPGLDPLVRSMLAKKPQDRPQTMEQVVHALESCRVQIPRTASNAAMPTVEPPRADARAALAAAVKSTRRAWAFAAGWTLVSGVALSTLFILRPAPTGKAEVQVQLRSSPPGAEVYEGEVLLGQTPFTVPWEKRRAGRLRFELRGHAPEVRTIAPGADLALDIQLSPNPR